nr:hypothetical protein [Tanacetum cinerariifolium]
APGARQGRRAAPGGGRDHGQHALRRRPDRKRRHRPDQGSDGQEPVAGFAILRKSATRTGAGRLDQPGRSAGQRRFGHQSAVADQQWARQPGGQGR